MSVALADPIEAKNIDGFWGPWRSYTALVRPITCGRKNSRSRHLRAPFTIREPRAFFLLRPNIPGIPFYLCCTVPDASDSVLEPEQRRSKRVLLDVPLVVRGEAEDTHTFQE